MGGRGDPPHLDTRLRVFLIWNSRCHDYVCSNLQAQYRGSCEGSIVECCRGPNIVAGRRSRQSTDRRPTNSRCRAREREARRAAFSSPSRAGFLHRRTSIRWGTTFPDATPRACPPPIASKLVNACRHLRNKGNQCSEELLGLRQNEAGHEALVFAWLRQCAEGRHRAVGEIDLHDFSEGREPHAYLLSLRRKGPADQAPPEAVLCDFCFDAAIAFRTIRATSIDDAGFCPVIKFPS